MSNIENDINEFVPLSDEQLTFLAYLPLIIFNTVAGADGMIDRKEQDIFRIALLRETTTNSVLMKPVIEKVIENFDELSNKVNNEDLDSQQVLTEIKDILNKHVSEDEAMQFKEALMNMANSIAAASGGFLGIIGSKVDKKEKQAIDIVARFLGLE